MAQAAGVVTALVVIFCPRERICYVEWPTWEPMVNVIAALRDAESNLGVAFDMLDPDLWEYPEGGYRVHGLFREDLIGEE